MNRSALGTIAFILAVGFAVWAAMRSLGLRGEILGAMLAHFALPSFWRWRGDEVSGKTAENCYLIGTAVLIAIVLINVFRW